MQRFYAEKSAWAHAFLDKLEKRVEELSVLGDETGFHREDVAEHVHALVARARAEQAAATAAGAEAADDETSDDDEDSPTAAGALAAATASTVTAQERAVEVEHHRATYVAAKKGLQDFRRELTLLHKFVELNREAVRKIVKKFAKLAGTEGEREAYMAAHEASEAFSFLSGRELEVMIARVDELLGETRSMRPRNSSWERMKVYTVGCFDLAHRGHENLFRALREYGRFLVVGLHDDESYFRLKRKRTIDNLERRIANVKPFYDQVFVIPSTDPTPYLRAMVSDQDVREGTCCYVRGADMPRFPGREFVESVMPVYLLPRSEGVSSSLVRAIYHTEGGGETDADFLHARALAAAFAPLDDAGKPLVTEDMVEAELGRLRHKRELVRAAEASKRGHREAAAPAAASDDLWKSGE